MNPEVRNPAPRSAVAKDPQPYIDVLRDIVCAEEETPARRSAMARARSLLGETRGATGELVPLNYSLYEEAGDVIISRTAMPPGGAGSGLRPPFRRHIVAPRDWIERWLAAGPGTVKDAIEAWQTAGMPAE